MKKFSINCDYSGQMAPFDIFIGQPEGSHHPLHFQAKWLSDNKGGIIPTEVMDAISKLNELANKNGVLLEDLCVYALGSAQVENDTQTGDTEIEDTDENNAAVETEDSGEELLQESPDENDVTAAADGSDEELPQESTEADDMGSEYVEDSSDTDDQSTNSSGEEVLGDDNKNSNQ